MTAATLVRPAPSLPLGNCHRETLKWRIDVEDNASEIEDVDLAAISATDALETGSDDLSQPQRLQEAEDAKAKAGGDAGDSPEGGGAPGSPEPSSLCTSSKSLSSSSSSSSLAFPISPDNPILRVASPLLEGRGKSGGSSPSSSSSEATNHGESEDQGPSQEPAQAQAQAQAEGEQTLLAAPQLDEGSFDFDLHAKEVAALQVALKSARLRAANTKAEQETKSQEVMRLQVALRDARVRVMPGGATPPLMVPAAHPSGPGGSSREQLSPPFHSPQHFREGTLAVRRSWPDLATGGGGSPHLRSGDHHHHHLLHSLPSGLPRSPSSTPSFAATSTYGETSALAQPQAQAQPPHRHHHQPPSAATALYSPGRPSRNGSAEQAAAAARRFSGTPPAPGRFEGGSYPPVSPSRPGSSPTSSPSAANTSPPPGTTTTTLFAYSNGSSPTAQGQGSRYSPTAGGGNRAQHHLHHHHQEGPSDHRPSKLLVPVYGGGQQQEPPPEKAPSLQGSSGVDPSIDPSVDTGLTQASLPVSVMPTGHGLVAFGNVDSWTPPMPPGSMYNSSAAPRTPNGRLVHSVSQSPLSPFDAAAVAASPPPSHSMPGTPKDFAGLAEPGSPTRSTAAHSTADMTSVAGHSVAGSAISHLTQSRIKAWSSDRNGAEGAPGGNGARGGLGRSPPQARVAGGHTGNSNGSSGGSGTMVLHGGASSGEGEVEGGSAAGVVDLQEFSRLVRKLKTQTQLLVGWYQEARAAADERSWRALEASLRADYADQRAQRRQRELRELDAELSGLKDRLAGMEMLELENRALHQRVMALVTHRGPKLLIESASSAPRLGLPDKLPGSSTRSPGKQQQQQHDQHHHQHYHQLAAPGDTWQQSPSSPTQLQDGARAAAPGGGDVEALSQWMREVAQEGGHVEKLRKLNKLLQGWYAEANARAHDGITLAKEEEQRAREAHEVGAVACQLVHELEGKLAHMQRCVARRQNLEHINKELHQKVAAMTAGGAHVEALLRCLGSNLGFDKGRPVAACAVYKCMVHWNVVQAQRSSIYDRVPSKAGDGAPKAGEQPDGDAIKHQAGVFWNDVLASLRQCLETMRAHFVPAYVAHELLQQLLSFLDGKILNCLSNGETMEAGLALLDDWLAKVDSWAAAAHASSAPLQPNLSDSLRFIRQAFMLLTLEQIEELCPDLSAAQLAHLCTWYEDDRGGVTGVSPAVIVQLIPFTADDVARSMKEFDLESIEPPAELANDKAFYFLLPMALSDRVPSAASRRITM
eukprot:jgi/Mesen1/3692/ME000202S02781